MTADVIAQRLAYEATVLTSTAALRRAMRDPEESRIHRLSGMRASGIVKSGMSLLDAIQAIEAWMLVNYRNETIYKNAVANQLFFECHNWSSASHLTELRVAGSIADSVVVNGHATAYEIKSELDNPARLERQLCDYRKVFRFVYVVTYEGFAEAYGEVVNGAPVGLIVLDDKGRLKTRQTAPEYSADLDIATMMKSLRKAEYTSIAEQLSGGPVVSTPVRHFADCLDVVKGLDPIEFAGYFEEALRRRRPREIETVSSDLFRSVRHQILKIDPSSQQAAGVAAWMQRKV